MHSAEITGYLVVSPGIKQPQGTSATLIPNHYVLFQGNPEAPLLVSAALMEQIPHLIDCLPVHFTEDGEFSEGVRKFLPGAQKDLNEPPPIFNAEIR